MPDQISQRESLILYAEKVLDDIAFMGVTEMPQVDVRLLNRAMETPGGSWDKAALCLTEENAKAFNPDEAKTRYKRARKICGQCTVRAQCLLNGLERDPVPQTMLAGLSSREFTTMRKALGLKPKTPRANAVEEINRCAQVIRDAYQITDETFGKIA